MAGGADHLLLDTVRRRLRQPTGWVAVALHLSRLTPPAPRPHHRRIARVLMEDAARRYEGLVFSLVNGDLLLLCRAGEERRPVSTLRVATPQALPEVLARLLRADVPEPRDLVSLWPLETTGELLLAYALERAGTASTVPATVREARSQPNGMAALATAISGPEVADLLHRQTAVIVTDDGMRPLFREIRFSMAALEGKAAAVSRTEADPYLLRHLVEQLDRRLLAVLGHALGRGEGLDPALANAPRPHINLTLASLRSDGFIRLAEAMLARGLSLGVEVSVLDACGDPDRFEQARQALRRLDMTLVLDGVQYQAVRFARVAALQPDLVKLAWSPRMAEPQHAREDGVAELIAALGPDRVLLHHAETEAALRWGLERGVRRFQGRQVDAMLGALRLSICPLASGCTLQQCIERAAATDPKGRAGCGNHRLLDAGGPGPVLPPQIRPVAAARDSGFAAAKPTGFPTPVLAAASLPVSVGAAPVDA